MAATKDLETASAQDSAPVDAMDTTADFVSEKKSKKEKKEKKDKSSKKRKATEEPAESAETVDTMDTTADADAAAASSDEKPKKSSKKRKAELTEIEIDVTAPEPPSKKAKRLLKKGKTLPTKPSSDKGDDSDDNSDNETATGKDGDKDKKKKKEKKERSPHGVWIGNLRFTVTKSELKQWLVDNSGGSITPESITRVHMPTAKAQPGQPKKEKPENRGFAYVDFDSLATKVAAIALSETEWYKRKLLIKDATSFEGRPEKKKEDDEDAKGAAGGKKDEALVGGKFAGSTKIFVGNLSFDTTEDDLRNHFDKCGAIRWVKVATFEDSGKCKGYGWVNFEEGEAAQWAVKGFVKIREEIPELEDFMDEDQKAEAEAAADGDNADAEKTKEKKETEKRIKTRKWWVNQLHGRTLKIELAEDDKTRYDKRFRGKGAAGGKKQGQDGGERPQRVPYKKREEGGNGQIKMAQDISVARLTGAPVAHQGKKTTFE
ncbi:hypothetical protein GE21DRAFT_8265 [Neurospora crassa]|uniref:RNA-binding protein n=2 Tax=Neurospora crassa TaxID=5141 RepID=Q1K795_NEUCR|nr:RNA-binding protein [Neurospora crassa OR74A]EAA31827.1 RNA-binding protein [Neurospora crassa OR74A]KHE86124.1 hypothetical protein GE21DRAFT_8265 [Neurospora crassa]CAC28739.1 conserved hypothetical protein [Neurospora crassa]|eukprot:XP_961063.1 RNA-binding protein [Neurospora crassa OR74A]